MFSLETMPFLADHCVIAQPPDWPDMSDRFPVVPLTTLLEVMADAARELLPGERVVGFADVRAVRWIVAAPPTTAVIHASLLDDTGPRRVKVDIRGHAHGTVLLADAYPSPPPPDRTPLTAVGPPVVTADRLYEERWMFHGPLFRGVTEVSAFARDGLRGALTSLPTPGALLDSAGQLCGHWIQVCGEDNQIVYPVAIDRLSLYGPLPPAGQRLETTVWNRALTENTMRCDAEMVLPGGTVWARIDGWKTHRFYTDEAVWHMRLSPERSGTGEPQEGGWCLARPRWDGAASRDLLMRQYLGAAERAEYEALPSTAQASWLLGRIAAKDAVRDHLWRTGHGPLFPAELTVLDDPGHRPVVTGPFDEPLTLSVASAAELAVALVRPGREPAGIGIVPDGRDAQAGAAKQAALRSMPSAPNHLEPVVTEAGPDQVRIAVDGTVVTVRTRQLDGHVVAWTAPSGTDKKESNV